MIRRRVSPVLVFAAALALCSAVALAQPNPGAVEGLEVEPATVCSELPGTAQPQQAEPATPDPMIILPGDTNLMPTECIGLSGHELCDCMCAASGDPACWVKNC